MRIIWNERSAMRDGVELSCDVYLPEDSPGPWPTLLHRTPYDNQITLLREQAERFGAAGYAVVLQDVRGRHDSDGTFLPFLNEAKDGHDTVEWIAAQTWCTGKVGMFGGSYAGYVQWLTARERAPHLSAIAPSGVSMRPMQDAPWVEGKFRPHWIYWLHITSGRDNHDAIWGAGTPTPIDFREIRVRRPLADADIAVGNTKTQWREWLAHNTQDAYWEPVVMDGHFEGIDVPALHITGWHDGLHRGAVDHLWRRMRDESPAAERQVLIAGPWTHAGTRRPEREVGELDFGETAPLDMDGVLIAWFDRWLKGEENETRDWPAARVFCMGRNQWLSLDDLPDPRTEQRSFFLAADGSLAAEPGDEGSDEYVYDPSPGVVAEAVPQVMLEWGRVAARPARADELVFETAPLSDELVVAGSPRVELWAASDVEDTDFVAIVEDVHPDGRSYRIGYAALRVTHRESFVEPTPIEPGKPYRFELSVSPSCIALAPGHRLRVVICSAMPGQHDINPNTGAPAGEDLPCRPARQQVLRGAAHPSRLIVPTLGSATVDAAHEPGVGVLAPYEPAAFVEGGL